MASGGADTKSSANELDNATARSKRLDMATLTPADNEDIYEVEKIVGMTEKKGKTLYKVRWAGYSPAWDTWEPYENLLSCADMIDAYVEEHRKRKKEPRSDESGSSDEDKKSKKGKKKPSYIIVTASDDEADTLKDKFWRDLEQGKVNVFGSDMYSKVKGGGRKGDVPEVKSENPERKKMRKNPAQSDFMESDVMQGIGRGRGGLRNVQKGMCSKESHPGTNIGRGRKRGRKLSKDAPDATCFPDSGPISQVHREIKIEMSPLGNVEQMTAAESHEDKNEAECKCDEIDSEKVEIKQEAKDYTENPADNPSIETRCDQESDSGDQNPSVSLSEDVHSSGSQENGASHDTSHDQHTDSNTQSPSNLQSSSFEMGLEQVTPVCSPSQRPQEQLENSGSSSSSCYIVPSPTPESPQPQHVGQSIPVCVSNVARRSPSSSPRPLGIRTTPIDQRKRLNQEDSNNNENLKRPKMTVPVVIENQTETLTEPEELEFDMEFDFGPEDLVKDHDEEDKLAPAVQPGELWQAVRDGDYYKVRRALKSHRPYNLENQDLNGMTLAMVSAYNGFDDILELLAIHGANINAQNKAGMTALMYAVDQGHLCTVGLLVQMGVYLNTQLPSGETALMKAVKRNQRHIVKLLLENGANFALQAQGDITPLKLAKSLNLRDIHEMCTMHISKITSTFESQVLITLNNTAKIMHALFPLQCFSLCEGEKFTVSFKHELQPTVPGMGMLLFIAHAIISPQEVKCRFYGPCAVRSVLLNDQLQPSLTEEASFVLSFSPILNGRNLLEIHTVRAPASRAKLLVCAYRAQLTVTGD